MSDYATYTLDQLYAIGAYTILSTVEEAVNKEIELRCKQLCIGAKEISLMNHFDSCHIGPFDCADCCNAWPYIQLLTACPTTYYLVPAPQYPAYSSRLSVSQYIQCPACPCAIWLDVSQDGDHDYCKCFYCGFEQVDGSAAKTGTESDDLDDPFAE